MLIAVLGASGVAGRQFVPLATAAGHHLRTERVDLFDADALYTRLRGCDAVVNLATSIPKPGGRGDWASNDRIRRDGTRTLLAAAAAAGVSVVLQQSVAMLHCVLDHTPQRESDPTAGYGVIASAFDMEALCRASPLDVRLVRGGLFYGPGTGREEQWQREAHDPAFRVPGAGSAWWSLLYVADFASALLAVLERGAAGGRYIATEDQPVQVGALYAAVARQWRRPAPAIGGGRAHPLLQGVESAPARPGLAPGKGLRHHRARRAMSAGTLAIADQPCQQCGACCAAYRVSFYWSEAAALPPTHVEQIGPLMACMAGTNRAAPRCLALEGTIGEAAGCAIYAQRPHTLPGAPAGR